MKNTHEEKEGWGGGGGGGARLSISILFQINPVNGALRNLKKKKERKKKNKKKRKIEAGSQLSLTTRDSWTKVPELVVRMKFIKKKYCLACNSYGSVFVLRLIGSEV